MNIDSRPVRRCLRWFRGSVNGRILGAAAVIGFSTLLVKAVATLKELAVAHAFGTGDVVDAWVVAFILPSFAISVIVGGLEVALIPVYIQVRENEGMRAAERMFASASVASLALTGAVVVLLAGAGTAALPLLGSGFGVEKLALTRSLFLLLLPVVLLGGLATLWTAALNAEARFGLPALAPISVPLATLLAVILTGPVWGIYSLVVGVLSGYALQGAVLALAVKRTGLRVWPAWNGVTPELRAVGRQYLPKVAGGFLTSGAGLVDQAMAAMLAAGSVASLHYGSKVGGLVVGLAVMALGTALLPHYSLMVARQEWEGIRATVRRYAGLILLVTIPTAILLVVFSDDIVRALFERGAFTARDTRVVARVQALYVLQLPFHLLGILFVRLISSLQANRFLMFGAAISLTVNVALNWVFMRWMGVAGIALSTSAVYVVSFIYLGFVLRRLLPRAEAAAASIG